MVHICGYGVPGRVALLVPGVLANAATFFLDDAAYIEVWRAGAAITSDLKMNDGSERPHKCFHASWGEM